MHVTLNPKTVICYFSPPRSLAHRVRLVLLEELEQQLVLLGDVDVHVLDLAPRQLLPRLGKKRTDRKVRKDTKNKLFLDNAVCKEMIVVREYQPPMHSLLPWTRTHARSGQRESTSLAHTLNWVRAGESLRAEPRPGSFSDVVWSMYK